MKKVNIGREFYNRLANRNKFQGDGKHNAVEFREKYLSGLEGPDKWSGEAIIVEFDFMDVGKIGPSFANEAFAYFMQYTNPDNFKKKISFKNISRVQKMIIDEELQSGYSK